MGYKKPTLVETYAEIHLVPESLTESRFFEVVPKLKDLGFTEVEFAAAGLSIDFKSGTPFPRERQRVRCWKPGKTELVQVGEDLLVVNLTGEYPGWDAFVGLFEKGVRALTAGLNAIEIRSLNLATSDRFQVPHEGFVVSDFLAVGGAVIPAWYADCRESLDLDMGYGLLDPDGRNRQIHVNVRAAEDPVTVAIGAHFHDRIVPGADLQQVLTRLHAESNKTFESLITDRVRSGIMGGRV